MSKKGNKTKQTEYKLNVDKANQIKFYGLRNSETDWLGPYYVNDSYTFEMDGATYSSVWQCFQAGKFRGRGFESIRQQIIDADSPLDANRIASQYNFNKIQKMQWAKMRDSIMETVLMQRFKDKDIHLISNEPNDLGDWLVETEDAMLIYDHPKDGHWGYKNGKGKNRYGELLMLVRQKIMEDRSDKVDEYEQELKDLEKVGSGRDHKSDINEPIAVEDDDDSDSEDDNNNNNNNDESIDIVMGEILKAERDITCIEDLYSDFNVDISNDPRFTNIISDSYKSNSRMQKLKKHVSSSSSNISVEDIEAQSRLSRTATELMDSEE